MDSSTPESQSESQLLERSPKVRFAFLDGLRGLTALYVVLVHIYREVDPTMQGDGLPVLMYSATRWFAHGRNAVSIFIVLSGFCLMLPVVRSPDGQLRGGVVQYLQRRAWRILPPYYIALGLVLLLFAVIPQPLQAQMGVAWQEATPDWSVGTIGSHLLLIHNWDLRWIYKIAIPMWSVATEWQIYFVLPMLLLIWRRLGILAAVAIAVVVGIAPHYLLAGKLDQAIPWFLGLFALGMAAAELLFSPQSQLAHWQRRFPWKWLIVFALMFLIAIYAVRPAIDPDFRYALICDFLVGVASTALIIDCAIAVLDSSQFDHHPVLRFLELRWVKQLGSFSYSLYLIHLPVLGLVELPLARLHLTPVLEFWSLMGLGLPSALAIAYGFHRLFEKPFLEKTIKIPTFFLKS